MTSDLTTVTLPRTIVTRADDPQAFDDFMETLLLATFPGDATRKDVVHKLGFNTGTTDARAALYHQLESFYAINAGERWMEYHLNARGLNNAWLFRPFQVNVSPDTGLTNIMFKTDIFYLHGRESGEEWLSIPLSVRPHTLFVGLPMIVNAKKFSIRLPGTTLNGFEVDPTTRNVKAFLPTTIQTDATTTNNGKPALLLDRPGRRDASVTERVGLRIADQSTPAIAGDGKLTKTIGLEIQSQQADDATALRTNSGRVEFGDDVFAAKGVILTSPSGAKWRLQVDNAGALSTVAAT